MRAVLLAIFVYSGGLSVHMLRRPLRWVRRRSFVNEYCVSCHNDRVKRGELSLIGVDADRPEPENPIWEKAIRKVRTGMMPPVNAKRPDGNRIEASPVPLKLAGPSGRSRSQSWKAAAAPAQSNRVCERRARRSVARHRRDEAVAPRRHDPRVRQYRRCSDDFADADG